ncbi:MAG: hypothetical protein WBF93_13780 [Pirellulales bacterium]|nr:hypothetical protein [Pirellulales bacterium]
MQAYILNSDKLISPFMRPAREMRIHNVSLGDRQTSAFKALGCRVERIDTLAEIDKLPALVVHDDLFLTAAAAKKFLQLARKEGGNRQAALECSLLTEHMVPALQGPQVAGKDQTNFRVYDSYYIEQLDASRPLQMQSELLPIPYGQRTSGYRTSRQFEESGRMFVPMSTVFMMPVRHWAAVLAANLAGMPGFFLQTIKRHWLQAGMLPLVAAIRAHGLSPAHWRSKSYLAGPRCRIAPSAHVETSILGRRVKVAPHAVIRNSVLGDRVLVREGALVEGCSLGDDVIVEAGSRLRGSVAEEGACIASRFIQLSVFGRDSVVCPESGTTDFVIRGTVKIDVDGKKISSGSRYLGCCVGDGAFLGPNVHLVGGVEIPNGCQLIPNPRGMVTDANTGIPSHLLRVDKGRSRRRAA